jgi:hypothetical protein
VLTNHIALSEPTVIVPGYSCRPVPIPGPVNLLTMPAVVIRPIELSPAFTNHNAPSGPLVMAHGCDTPLPAYVVRSPAVDMCPIELPRKFVNHNAPSAPVVTPHASEIEFGAGKLETETESARALTGTTTTATAATVAATKASRAWTPTVTTATRAMPTDPPRQRYDSMNTTYKTSDGSKAQRKRPTIIVSRGTSIIGAGARNNAPDRQIWRGSAADEPEVEMDAIATFLGESPQSREPPFLDLCIRA